MLAGMQWIIPFLVLLPLKVAFAQTSQSQKPPAPEGFEFAHLPILPNLCDAYEPQLVGSAHTLQLCCSLTHGIGFYCLNWFRSLRIAYSDAKNNRYLDTTSAHDLALLREKFWQDRCSDRKSIYCCTGQAATQRTTMDGVGVNCIQADEYAKNRKGKPRKTRKEDTGNGEGNETKDGSSSHHRLSSPHEKKRIRNNKFKIPDSPGRNAPFLPGVEELIKKSRV